jgi:hypothetical protein
VFTPNSYSRGYLGKSATETLAMIRQAFAKERMSRKRNSNINGTKKKKAREVKSMILIILFDIKVIVEKEPPGRPNSQIRILL